MSHKPATFEEMINWIEQVNTLHRQIDILYVVDGYQVTITWDGNAISPDFHGETVAEAISKAMAGFDLDSGLDRKQFRSHDPIEIQLDAVEQQRDELLAALDKLANCNLTSEAVRKIAGEAIERAKAGGV